jgi:hypothetical protein
MPFQNFRDFLGALRRHDELIPELRNRSPS